MAAWIRGHSAMSLNPIPANQGCPACNGTGQELKAAPLSLFGGKPAYRTCRVCGGSGRIKPRQ